jgi:hypothetical protein
MYQIHGSVSSMSKRDALLVLLALLLVAPVSAGLQIEGARTAPLIIDHTATALAALPQGWFYAWNRLETDYPQVAFVYMTGHLDGIGISGNLNQRNNQIRQFCRAHNKVLYDFADIESMIPMGTNT